MSINSEQPAIHYKSSTLSDYDIIIPRIGASVTAYGTAVVRQAEMIGKPITINGSLAITRARDKFRALQLLARKGIGLPITSFAYSPDDIGDLIQMVGGTPLIIKLLQGTQGMGVILVETRKAAESILEAFLGMQANIMVQEYIKEANGADIRCFVVGGKVVASMKRQAKPGEFRSNLHRGGLASPIKITAEERMTAERTAKIMGLNVAGVDIMRSSRGPLVLEVNSSPGLEGIETTTGKNIAGYIIEFAEKQASKGYKATKQA
jgi:ribosomal protein S6--L-glutamate ligase